MTINLPEELERSVQAEVLSGHFASADEVVAEAVRHYLSQRQTESPKVGDTAFDVLTEAAWLLRHEPEGMRALSQQLTSTLPAHTSAGMLRISALLGDAGEKAAKSFVEFFNALPLELNSIIRHLFFLLCLFIMISCSTSDHITPAKDWQGIAQVSVNPKTNLIAVLIRNFHREFTLYCLHDFWGGEECQMYATNTPVLYLIQYDETRITHRIYLPPEASVTNGLDRKGLYTNIEGWAAGKLYLTENPTRDHRNFSIDIKTGVLEEVDDIPVTAKLTDKMMPGIKCLDYGKDLIQASINNPSFGLPTYYKKASGGVDQSIDVTSKQFHATIKSVYVINDNSELEHNKDSFYAYSEHIYCTPECRPNQVPSSLCHVENLH